VRYGPRLKPSDSLPRDKEEYQPKHKKNEEENLRNSHRRSGNSGESKKAGYQGDNEKYY
jgi:hypothetical protein